VRWRRGMRVDLQPLWCQRGPLLSSLRYQDWTPPPPSLGKGMRMRWSIWGRRILKTTLEDLCIKCSLPLPPHPQIKLFFGERKQEKVVFETSTCHWFDLLIIPWVRKCLDPPLPTRLTTRRMETITMKRRRGARGHHLLLKPPLVFLPPPPLPLQPQLLSSGKRKGWKGGDWKKKLSSWQKETIRLSNFRILVGRKEWDDAIFSCFLIN